MIQPEITKSVSDSAIGNENLLNDLDKSCFGVYNPWENITLKGAIIRGAMVLIMPLLCAIDWNYGADTLMVFGPVIIYLEITAFTQYCPIKALFLKYRTPDNRD